MKNDPWYWPSGAGEIADRIRIHDWAATSLGPCDRWSQRLRLMVEQVMANPLVATLACGPDRLLIYNDAAARLFGDHHPAALGRPLPSVFPAGWETVAPFYERAFAGEVVTVAGQPLDTRGEGAPTEVFDALLMPVREADGHVAYVHMTGFDIAGRQRAEAALRDSEERLRMMLDNLVQATWETDAAGMVTIDSPSWRAYTGQSLTQWLGYGWLDAIHIEDRAYAERQWREAVAACRDVNAEFRLRLPNGGWRWTNVRAVPSLDDEGHVRKWMGVNIDIDARRQAGEELEQRVADRTAELQQALDTLQHEARERKQAEERLRQSEKLKAVGQLTGGIAHDFNNILQGITSALALVQTRLEEGRVEAAQSYIEPAQKAAARAGALTHRLLAFSRQQTLSPRPVNLERIARDMEDMIRRTVGPAVQVELKSSDAHWLVLCDLNQMESALLNLCINARDAMPEGGWLTIGIEDRVFEATELAGFEDLRPGRFVVLSITDTGSGMPPEVMARAFEPFFTTKPPGQGTGLGLSQIYGFMRQSDGLVQIETALGAGTTVRLGLPAHERDPREPRDTTKIGKTLLLVEDEHDLRRMLADQLRDLGYGVLEADSAESALRILHMGHQVDLLVTDLGLRGAMNGRQLAEAAQLYVKTLPIIFITGYAGGSLLLGDSVLRKPFKPAMLALLVNEKIG